MDERLFGDTIFRAEKLGDTYVVSDVFVFNSTCIFVGSTFKQRYEWLKEVIKRFYTRLDGFAKLIHKSELPEKTVIKGYELYDNKEGSHGSFVEENIGFTVNKTDIPDVYTVDGQTGYVLVPDLKTSVYLRSKGNTFQLRCIQLEGNWSIQEDIPELK
jgi:hypothetical protein